MYGNPAAYESYMGHWSAALAPSFLYFACTVPPTSFLDVGCGTGSLLRAAAVTFPHSRLVGVDPVASYVGHARSTMACGRTALVAGAVERLPFADGAFDHCLSLLVLQEFQDRALALGEMHRVTRRDGVVAAAQWDFGRGMPMIAALRRALEAIVPRNDEGMNSGSAHAFATEDELRRHWEAAGFAEVETVRLAVTVSYGSFTDFWQPVLGGSTPATAAVASLPVPAQDAVRRHLRRTFLDGRRDGAFALNAEAFAVRGRVDRETRLR